MYKYFYSNEGAIYAKGLSNEEKADNAAACVAICSG